MKKSSTRVFTHPFPHGSCRLTAGFIVAVLAVFALGSCEKPIDPLPTYTVTFNADGGTPAPADQTVTTGEKLKEPTPAPTKADHGFGGWYKEAAFTTKWNFAADTVTENMTLYAKWNLNEYSVLFSVDGGTPAPESQTVGAGGKLTEPMPAPTKTGYNLDGWYKEAAFTNQWNFATDTVTANMTLYAKWVPIQYTVTFNANDGTSVPAVTVNHGLPITAPTAPTKADHIFDAWYKEAALTTKWNFTSDTVTAATTLYAKWLPVYNLTLETKTGQGQWGDMQITAGGVGTGQAAGSVTVQALAMAQYTFEKWTSDAAGTTPVSAANPYTFTINADTTLYAVFTALPIRGNQTTFIISGVDVNLRYVPEGSFQRDATATNISTITKGYWMAETEVTEELFKAIMGENPVNASFPNVSGESRVKRPVEFLTWYQAIAFCNKLSLAEGKALVYSVRINNAELDWENLAFKDIPQSSSAAGVSDWNAATQDLSKNGYRLPTEMEWMWAAMGADKTAIPNTTGYAKAFAGSDGVNSIGDYVWHSGNAGGTNLHEVGMKLPNEIGLYDMSGSVLEWCWDWYGDYPDGTLSDYQGLSTAANRVQRGGSFNTAAANAAIAYRSNDKPSSKAVNIGFRFVCP